MATTVPNKYAQAVALLDKIKNKEWTSVSFQVDLCPWCGTEIIPEGDAPDEAYAVHPANDSFRMTCANPECDFHDHLPVSSVDDDLYDNPPTVLIGTVDKFARLTWEGRAGVFLGAGDDPGPSLIIQDELHLISGPLGTIVGLYEAAFDVVMRRHGARPKIVASTATIRRAEEQVHGVFGRKVVMFPPSGLDADDSYFVRFDRDKPGRLYCGVMPQGHTPLTAMVHLSAALLQAPMEIPLTPPADDAYWTLVAYHNNLRELGKSVTLAHDDIPARMSVIAEAEDDVRPLHDHEILELTSNVPAAEIPGRLELLQRRRGEKGAVSFVASTNMISVGVDVPRLGLMLVSGQPKTTSEYIQATSRVGRGKVDGLVVTMFSPSRPRDRSHYESFVPYHSALYRAVEPTSVTPFAIPARESGAPRWPRRHGQARPGMGAQRRRLTFHRGRHGVAGIGEFLPREGRQGRARRGSGRGTAPTGIGGQVGRARARLGRERRTQVLDERRTRAHRAAAQVRRASGRAGRPLTRCGTSTCR